MQLNLHTLKYRRLRGDMIEVYKIIRHIYDSSVAPNLQLGNTGVTRGNKINKLLNHTFRSNSTQLNRRLRTQVSDTSMSASLIT